MIKSKVFGSEKELNTFEQSYRVLVISIETIRLTDREHIKMWYREVDPLKNKKKHEQKISEETKKGG